MDGKTVFVVGGSAGLGKEISKVLAAQGANVTIFARSQQQLDEAKEEIIAARQNENQTITAIAADMSNPSIVHILFNTQSTLPDTLYCVAGGTSTELGFLVDLAPDVFERSMNKNYYSSLYPAQAALQSWISDDQDAPIPPSPKARKIVFVNSSASLIPTPGYLAYAAAKSAQRALADVLRLEATRYSGPKSTYKVQCVFAHNFITPTFIEEQANKPALTKKLESTEGDLKTLEKNFPSAEKIAPEIVANIENGDYAVMDGRFEPQICWGVAMGGSPKRGWGVWDSILGVLAWVAWPVVRWGWEKECKGEAFRALAARQ
ncbi:short chain dehydrogenase [Amniculicola lignicola CBS 123094]|uniref:Short chain dehydrogenase n=1 Tax=Amniculicola lignicola CBS 123094 TaxID=1392246 RepID=A0A6A5WBF8_9PLEO|nr:short chain dehydrogenase [Amniculicola lignicola CBS 123094]